MKQMENQRVTAWMVGKEIHYFMQQLPSGSQWWNIRYTLKAFFYFSLILILETCVMWLCVICNTIATELILISPYVIVYISLSHDIET